MTADVLSEDRTGGPEPAPVAVVPGHGRTVAGEPVRRLVRVALGLLVIAVTLVFVATARGHEMSITDEVAHADYTYQIAYGTIPAKGTLVAPEIRSEWYCHQEESYGAPCTGYDETYEADAQDYTFGDPPVYYAVTGYLTRFAGVLIPGSADFVTVARDIGALWLFGAMIVLYLALRRFRVGWPYAAAGAALLPLVPGVLAATTEITSDAPAALCGAAALYVLARYLEEHKTGWALPLAVTVLSWGTKTLNGLPMLVVAGVLFCLSASALRRGDRKASDRHASVAATIVVSFIAVYFVWTEWQAHRGQANWLNPNLGNGQALTGSPMGDFLSSTFGLFGHLTTGFWLQPEITGESVVIWATGLGVLLAGAPLLILAAQRTRSAAWILGFATLAGIASVTFVVQAQTYLANNEFFAGVAPRYALSFLPWAIGCLAVFASRRRLLRTTTWVVSIGLVVMLLAVTGLFTLGPALTQTSTSLVG